MANDYLKENILLRHKDIPNIGDIDVYLSDGGYQGLKKALETMGPADVINTVKASGLRGRGGAGFPTGVKWSFIPKGAKDVYIVVNADESEPGTFKDRELMEYNPHRIIEGAAIAAYAVGAHTVFIYGRGEFSGPFVTLQKAVDQAYERGMLGENTMGTDYALDVHLHLGAGAYICGEETALLNSLEGYRGYPRSRPPFPAIEGLYAKPTVINNVETMANVPGIIVNGVEWYRQFGTEKSAGTKVFCLSGHVNRPGNYELPLGVPIRYLIEELGGGVPNGKRVKAVLPAGESSLMVPESQLDTPMDYESMGAIGSMLGSASFIVMDETVDIVWAAEKMIHFFKHESCGKCSPCREGTYWLSNVYHRIRSGEGSMEDIELLTKIVEQISGNTFCPLGEFATSSVKASLLHFRHEYERYVEK